MTIRLLAALAVLAAAVPAAAIQPSPELLESGRPFDLRDMLGEAEAAAAELNVAGVAERYEAANAAIFRALDPRLEQRFPSPGLESRRAVGGLSCSTWYPRPGTELRHVCSLSDAGKDSTAIWDALRVRERVVAFGRSKKEVADLVCYRDTTIRMRGQLPRTVYGCYLLR